MDKQFFDTVRPLFGTMTAGQVDGMNRIVEYGKANAYSRLETAYLLGTAKHETGSWMQPIREGALRYGPAYTDEQSQRAVGSIYAKGIIRTNYALPTGPWGKSYYGRGLIQITWYDNYVKFGIAEHPDKALLWPTALDIMFRGCRDGMFTGKRLSMIQSPGDFFEARAIVSGDKNRKNSQGIKIGTAIAYDAGVFWRALESYSPVVTISPEPPVTPAVCTAPVPVRPELHVFNWEHFQDLVLSYFRRDKK